MTYILLRQREISLGFKLKCKVGVVYTFGVIYRRDESYPTPRTSYILSKRPGYIWIIGIIELGLEDSRVDEADLTHTYTPSSNSENV